MLQWLYTYVSSVCSNCFRCTSKVFYLDVANIDLDVAHVFQVFSVASNVYLKCFIWTLHIFCNGYTRVFWCFRRMLQVFHLDVAKADRVLQWDPPA